MAETIKHPKVLLVEGKDEINFIGALLKHCNIDDIDIQEVGGKDNFPSQLAAFLLSFDKQVQAYAIIRDADNGAASAFQSVVGLLQKQKEPVPTGPTQYAENDKRRVGVFIMPGNQSEGMLEDLCMQTVADHPAMNCVDGFIGCLEQALPIKHPNTPKTPGQSYFPKNLSKAKAQVFLSSQYESVSSVGLAAQKGYWNLDHTVLDDLKAFIRAL